MAYLPVTFMAAEDTTVLLPLSSVLEHVTVLPPIAAVTVTVKTEDRQYVEFEGRMLKAV